MSPQRRRPESQTLLDAPLTLVHDPLLGRELQIIARKQLGYLTTAQLAANGVPQRTASRRVRAGRWRRATRGVFDVALDPLDAHPVHVRKVRRALLALLAFGPDAIAVGGTALILHGVWGVPESRAPQIALPAASSRRNRDGLVCRRFEKGVAPVLVHGVRAAPPVVALAQMICETSPRQALGLLDSALRRGVISRGQLDDVRRAIRRRRGCRRIAHVFDLVDERRESPPESQAWYDLREVGLVPTAIQIEIRDDDGFAVARPDMGYEFEDGSWLFVEIDGDAYHEEGNEDDPARDARLIEVLEARWIEAEVLRFRPSTLGLDGTMIGEVREKVAGRPRMPAHADGRPTVLGPRL